jgi:hypothetical protein
VSDIACPIDSVDADEVDAEVERDPGREASRDRVGRDRGSVDEQRGHAGAGIRHVSLDEDLGGREVLPTRRTGNQ